MAISMLMRRLGRPTRRSGAPSFLVALMAPDECRKEIKLWETVSDGDRMLGGGPTYRLPEGQEDDQLDGEDLQEGLILANVVFNLDVELDQAVHGD